jgi:hypothetical protein
MKNSMLSPFSRFATLVFAIDCAQSSLQATTVIYADDFSGSGSLGLQGQELDTASGLAGGTSGATWTAGTAWKADGSKGNGTANAFLAFTPQTGLVYTLSMDNVTVNTTTTEWLAGGFLTGGVGTNTNLYDAAAPWMLIRGKVRSGDGGTDGANDVDNNVHAYGSNLLYGEGSNETLTSPFTGNFDIVLDTTGSFWKAEWFFNGVSFHTLDFATVGTNPSITSVGIGGYASATGSVGSFSLTCVPEPTGALAGALLGAGMLRRKRSRLKGSIQ